MGLANLTEMQKHLEKNIPKKYFKFTKPQISNAPKRYSCLWHHVFGCYFFHAGANSEAPFGRALRLSHHFSGFKSAVLAAKF